MRCQWPVLKEGFSWKMPIHVWAWGKGRRWRKCLHDAHYTVLGLEVCLQHAYKYRRRIHSQWIREGILGPKARHSFYCRTSAEIKRLDTGEIDQTIKEADALSLDLKLHLATQAASHGP